jgi:hypothetical protein
VGFSADGGHPTVIGGHLVVIVLTMTTRATHRYSY